MQFTSVNELFTSIHDIQSLLASGARTAAIAKDWNSSVNMDRLRLSSGLYPRILTTSALALPASVPVAAPAADVVGSLAPAEPVPWDMVAGGTRLASRARGAGGANGS